MSEPNIADVIGTAMDEGNEAVPKPGKDCLDEDCACGSDEPATSNDDAKVSCWANRGGSYYGINKTYQELPSKCYKTYCSNSLGYYLEEQPIITDNLLVLPDDASKQILQDFKQFWTL